jgi:hypothetical protein
MKLRGEGVDSTTSKKKTSGDEADH